MMDRARAEIILTDVLAGAGSVQELDELERYEAANPDFKEYRECLETVWGLGGAASFSTHTGSDIFRAKICGMAQKVLSKGRKGRELSLDSLDRLAAAGTEMLDLEQDADK